MIRGLQFSLAFLASAWLMPALAEEPKEVKPVATAKELSRSGSMGPFGLKRDAVVIKNAEELVALTSKADSAKDEKVQMQMEAELAKLLKVEAIDWKKHVVIGAITDKFDSLTLDGKVLTVTYVPYKETLARTVPNAPKILILIERPEGEVKFIQKK